MSGDLRKALAMAVCPEAAAAIAFAQQMVNYVDENGECLACKIDGRHEEWCPVGTYEKRAVDLIPGVGPTPARSVGSTMALLARSIGVSTAEFEAMTVGEFLARKRRR